MLWRLVPWLDYASSRSLSSRFRERRLRFVDRVMALQPGMRILDAGGMPSSSLLSRRLDLNVTYLNLYEPERVAHTLPPEHGYIQADATEMPLKPHAFDVVFSNSLLEHLDPASQRAAAAEIRRVGRAYFVQVPYRYFPWEPHYNLPFVQFAPEPLKRFLWRRWWLSLGRRHQQPYERIYLPSRADMRRLFPSSTVVSERAGPVPKALYAWSPPTP